MEETAYEWVVTTVCQGSVEDGQDGCAAETVGGVGEVRSGSPGSLVASRELFLTQAHVTWGLVRLSQFICPLAFQPGS